MIRPAVPADVPRLVALVRALADYERSLEQVELTDDQLHEALFGPDPAAGVLVAEQPAAQHEARVVGFALWFRTFSTWTGVPALYLEDLFVDPEHRGAGHGRDLLGALAALALARGWRRLDWWVLDWNAPAIGFYRRLGATAMDGWTTYRLTGDALTGLARADGPTGSLGTTS